MLPPMSLRASLAITRPSKRDSAATRIIPICRGLSRGRAACLARRVTEAADAFGAVASVSSGEDLGNKTHRRGALTAQQRGPFDAPRPRHSCGFALRGGSLGQQFTSVPAQPASRLEERRAGLRVRFNSETDAIPARLRNDAMGQNSDSCGATSPWRTRRNAPTPQFVLNELAILVPIWCASSAADFS